MARVQAFAHDGKPIFDEECKKAIVHAVDRSRVTVKLDGELVHFFGATVIIDEAS